MLAAVVCLACRLVKTTSTWGNKNETLEAEHANRDQIAANLSELNEEGLAARVEQAKQQQDEAQAALERWVWGHPCAPDFTVHAMRLAQLKHASWVAPCSAILDVEAAQNELAGAEAGDGRDASNRSMQERLEDAQNAQVWCSICSAASTLILGGWSISLLCHLLVRCRLRLKPRPKLLRRG